MKIPQNARQYIWDLLFAADELQGCLNNQYEDFNEKFCSNDMDKFRAKSVLLNQEIQKACK